MSARKIINGLELRLKYGVKIMVHRRLRCATADAAFWPVAHGDCSMPSQLASCFAECFSA